MKRIVVMTIAACGLATLSGCGLFGGGDDDEVDPPAELIEFDAQLTVKKRWSTRVGGNAEGLRLGLAPVSDAVRVYAASHNGEVHALDPANGDKHWSVKLRMALTAGPGVGDGRVVVAGGDGEVIALDAATGGELWRRKVAAEVLAKPAVGGERIVLRSADGRLIALNGASGEEEWVVEESIPRLTLRGTAAPVVAGNLAVCGFDNGRLMAVELLSGDVVWEQAMAAPSGRSDLERLVDIDGSIATAGGDLYVTGFQGQMAALALESGQTLWNRELSSYEGPGVDWLHAYVATDAGDVVALSRENGVEQWRNSELARRELTAPVPFASAVVVGDLEGYLHWLDAHTGALVARQRVAGSRISGTLEAEGDTLFVQSESGVLAAYHVPTPDS